MENKTKISPIVQSTAAKLFSRGIRVYIGVAHTHHCNSDHFWTPLQEQDVPISKKSRGANLSVFTAFWSKFCFYLFIFFFRVLNFSSELKLKTLAWKQPGPTWNSALEWAESSSPCHKRCWDKWVKIWNYGHEIFALCYNPTAPAWSLLEGEPIQPTADYQNLALKAWTHGQSPTECTFLLQLRQPSLGKYFGNPSEWDMVSSPLLFWKRNILNTNLRDKSGSCACAATAFARISMGFFLFFCYVPKYIFTEQRFQSTGGEGGKRH